MDSRLYAIQRSKMFAKFIHRFARILINRKLWHLIVFIQLFLFTYFVLPNLTTVISTSITNYYDPPEPIQTTKHRCTLASELLKMPAVYTEPNKFGGVNCSTTNSWISCNTSLCSIWPHILKEHAKIDCEYSEITMMASDNKLNYSNSRKFSKYFRLRHSDFAFVQCFINSSFVWRDIVAGTRTPIKRARPKSQFYNVIIHGIGSISRTEFLYRFNETSKYIVDKLNATILNAYNSPGDSTWDTLVPIIIGYSLENFEAEDDKLALVDQLVWNLYRNAGYITAFNGKDLKHPTIMSVQPPDHYINSYNLARARHFPEDACVGSKLINYTQQILKSNKYNPKFILNFDTTDQGTLNNKNPDILLKNWIMELHDSNVLSNTILFLMSDNGRPVNWTHYSMREKLDQNLPFFAVIVPVAFQQRFSSFYESLKMNADFLTAPNDVYVTLKHLLEIQSEPIESLNRNPSKFSNSLFANGITSERTCHDVRIRNEFCSCIQYYL